MLAEFFLTCVIVEITPGPNMAYLAALAMARGRLAGLAAVAGMALGLAFIGALSAVGLAEVIARAPLAYAVLRWAGVLYLLWLAGEAWRDSGAPVDRPLDAGTLGGLFGRGLLTNVLNPKAAVFYITVLPTFVVPGRPLVVQNLGLVAIYVGVATLIHAVIVLFSARVGRWVQPGARLRRVRRALAVTLALVAGWFAWETRT